MCDYCEMPKPDNYGYQFGESNIISFGTYMNDLTMNVCLRKRFDKEPILLIESDDINNEDGAFYIPISNCPMCGRKL